MEDQPSRKNLLIVGVGSIGLRHLRCFQATGRVRASICEPNAALRLQVAGEYQVESNYADLEAALADRHDAAIIAAPAHLHVPLALRLAEAGVHLLVEKPLSTTLKGIDTLRRLLADRHLVAAVAYVYRAHPILRAMKEAIAAGRFGRPLQVIAVGGQHFPTYRPAYREIYYRDRATGGGAIRTPRRMFSMRPSGSLARSTGWRSMPNTRCSKASPSKIRSTSWHGTDRCWAATASISTRRPTR